MHQQGQAPQGDGIRVPVIGGVGPGRRWEQLFQSSAPPMADGHFQGIEGSPRGRDQLTEIN